MSQLRSGRLLGGLNSNARVLATADFRAQLKTSLALTRGTGAPTFTRATTGTVVDHEGVIRTCLAGEARFTGARRVQNLWGIQSATLAVAASNTMTLPAGNYIFSMGAGTGTATFSGTGGATGTLAAGAGRVSVLKTISAGTLIVTGSVATLIDLQVEDVTGQSIQTAGEYVSVGVLSFPYHGSGVDGVKCFDTTLAGVPISAATLNGYLSEPARTNLLLRSQDFASWGGSNVTVTDSGIASPIVGVNFQKLTVTTTSATNCSQAVAGAGSTSGNTYSVYVKKGSGATECNRFNFYNNTTGQDLYRVTFNYDTGVFSALGGTGTASVDTFANGVYRLKLTNTGGVSNGDLLSVYCGFPGNVETAGKYLYAMGAQLEAGPYASSYIPTTTAAVTRNADVLIYPSAGNISDTAGTSYVAFSAQGITGSNQQILARDTNGRFPYVSSFTDRTQLYDGTTQNNATAGPSFVNSTQKSAQSWGAGTKSISYAGTAIASSAYDGTQGTGAIAIGCNNAGTEHLGGNVSDVCIWTRTLSDAILKRISK